MSIKNKDRIKFFIISICVLGLAGTFLSSVVLATDSAQVTATVTVQNIAIEFNSGSPTSIAYGNMGNNSSADTNPAGTITMKNNGNIAEDFQLKGNSVGDTPDWTLAAVAGSDNYVHKYCSATCGSPPTNYSVLTTAYTDSVVSDIAASATQAFDFYINTPNPSTVFTEQAVSISIRVVAH